MELRELECFLVLAEELHFGRTGERLYLSQSRVSQLLRALESRIGARLVERTSRRVRLTPLGEQFLARLQPAYQDLRTAVADTTAAARGVRGPLRLGFQGSANDELMTAIGRFGDRWPGCVTEVVEIPLADPFGPLYRNEVDAAVVLLPVAEPELVLGPVFSQRQQTLAVSVRHPFAARPAVTAEELADCTLIGIREPAPAYWRAFQAPARTPGGRPVPPGPLVGTLQEGLALAAADRGALLLCRPTAEHHRRDALAYLPVTGLPESSLGLVWHRDHGTATIRAFAEALTGGRARGARTAPAGSPGRRTSAPPTPPRSRGSGR